MEVETLYGRFIKTMVNLLVNSLNDNVGLIALLAFIGVVVAVAITIIVCIMTSSIKRAVVAQKPKFTNIIENDAQGNRWVRIKVCNLSFSDSTIETIGIANGNENFNFTEFYRKKNNLLPTDKIIIEQRNNIELTLSADEIDRIVLKDGKKFTLKTIRAYIIDSIGTRYAKRVRKARIVAKEQLNKDKIAYYQAHPEASFWYKFKRKKNKTDTAKVNEKKAKVEVKEEKKEENKDTSKIEKKD